MLNMSWRRGKSPGWAAFDYKQRYKHSLEPQADDEPFPPMPGPHTSFHPCKNLTNNDTQLPERSLSVVPLVTGNRDCKESLYVSESSSSEHNNEVLEDNRDIQKFKKLKDFHCWADESLIKDIMAAVDDDVGKASILLTDMVSTMGEADLIDLYPTSGNPSCDKNRSDQDKHVPSGEDINFWNLSSALEDCPEFNKTVSIDEYVSCDKILSDDDARLMFNLRQKNFIPFEPECDDVYLRHRKDAIRMTRVACQHSKAATNAFLRGNHFSAKQLSLKAREEWMAAERLNAKAAKEILSIRNSTDELWKLDLHGLHAAEAVRAVQERLQKIEFNLSFNRSVSPSRLKTSTGIVRSSSLECLSLIDTENLDKQQGFHRKRQTSLQIITGIGNHSRGQAALPTAVRSFLDANSYRFDESKPGVISVRPKFRPK